MRRQKNTDSTKASCRAGLLCASAFIAVLLTPGYAFACGFRPFLFGYGAINVYLTATYGIAGMMLVVSLFHVLLRRHKRKGKWLADSLFPLSCLMTVCMVPIIAIQIDSVFYEAARWWQYTPPAAGHENNIVLGCNPPTQAFGEMIFSLLLACFWLWIFRLTTRPYKLFPPFFKGQPVQKIVWIFLILFIWGAVHFYGWFGPTAGWVTLLLKYGAFHSVFWSPEFWLPQ